VQQLAAPPQQPTQSVQQLASQPPLVQQQVLPVQQSEQQAQQLPD